MAKSVEKDYINYKGKPLVRKNNYIYYGDLKDKYFVAMSLQQQEKVNEVEVARKVIVQLMKNDDGFEGKNKIIKRSQRTGVYDAIEIGTIWLEDALTWE